MADLGLQEEDEEVKSKVKKEEPKEESSEKAEGNPCESFSRVFPVSTSSSGEIFDQWNFELSFIV